MPLISSSVKKVFSDFLYLLLGSSLALNLLFLYYLVFLQTTTFEVFFASNNNFYNWTFLALTVVTSLLFGLAVPMTVFVWRQRKVNAVSGGSNSLFGAAFGLISTGCPVCGAWLLPTLGIAGSLTAFPFQGLEIKALSILLLTFSVNESAKSIAGVCQVSKTKILSRDKRHFVLNFNKETIKRLKPAVAIVASLILIPITRRFAIFHHPRIASANLGGVFTACKIE